MPKPRFISFPDQKTLADELAAHFLSALQQDLSDNELVHVSLTGGTMGSKILEAAGELRALKDIDWSRVHFWWSDERFVPTGHEDRNSQQAADALLASLDIPAENLHVIGASDQFDTAEKAAEAYRQELKKFAPTGAEYPTFGLSLLGMGPDGHIASLFPHRPEIHEEMAITLAVHDSPKPPPHRVTLTRPVICNSQQIWFMVSGEDKNAPLTRVMQASSVKDEELSADILTETPAAGARGLEKTIIWADAAAQGNLKFSAEAR